MRGCVQSGEASAPKVAVGEELGAHGQGARCSDKTTTRTSGGKDGPHKAHGHSTAISAFLDEANEYVVPSAATTIPSLTSGR